ncbi:MAG: lactonase family protein [Pirellulaceae bacterium]
MRLRDVFVMLAMLTIMTDSGIAETFDVWFGTTTPKNGLSKGVYHATFDAEKGKLTTPELVFGINNPGFLALHPNGEVLYSTGNIDDEDLLAALSIKEEDGKKTLEMINAAAIGDGGAAHLSTDQAGKILLSAQYGGGSTAMFELDEKGGIKARSDLQKHSGGSEVVKGRQDKPHAHWVGTSPDGKFAFVPDLGMDKVVIWKLDLTDMKLVEHGYGTLPPGSGPRHMKFSPDGKHIYVLNELALTVTVFDYDAEAGKMEEVQTIATISEEEKAKEVTNSASEIRVHSSGKFVFAANRGHDTITVFSVNADDGKLTHVENEPVRGSIPRNFNIDPTGKWLIAAGRDSNTAAVFSIDQETGELTYSQHSVMVPSPICVLFSTP